MTVDAPPGSPYHRLARTAAHRWWRPLAGTAAVIAGWVLLALLLFGVLAGAALGFAVIAAALPVVVLVARWVQRRPGGLATRTAADVAAPDVAVLVPA